MSKGLCRFSAPLLLRPRLVRDDIVYLPLHHQVIVWAMRTELDLPIHPFNFPEFRYARFVSPPAQAR
jgi:hypothetical protein